MRLSILLLCLFTPMASAIGVIEHYKNYAQTDYDQHGLWRFRLTAAEYTQDFTGLKKAHISQLLNLS
ncbi:MAG: hypothetical protein ACRCYV_04475, partial [Aeromonas sp.]